MFYLYILHSPEHDRYYVGSTEDIEKRLLRHNSGGVPSTQNTAHGKFAIPKNFIPVQKLLKESNLSKEKEQDLHRTTRSKNSKISV